MSYILDALRKSEQQRQATQPDTVADRILIEPSQPKKKPYVWMAALILSNLLVIGYFVWFFNQKTAPEKQPRHVENSAKTLLPKPAVPQQVIVNKINPPVQQPQHEESTSPSISQWVESKKLATIPQPKPSPSKVPLELKQLPVKKVTPLRKEAVQNIEIETSDNNVETPTLPTVKKVIPDLAELPYATRNSLPNLTINVFSYAHQPEDRFVIINMVKYKTGQLIKGSVKLKEIRPDSIIVEDGNNTFRIERP